MENEIGKSIKQGIQRAKLSQVELAKRLNVTPQAISAWIAGRILPSADKLVEIIRMLDLVPDLFSEHKPIVEPDVSCVAEPKSAYMNSVSLQIDDLQRRVFEIEQKQSVPTPIAVTTENRSLIELLERRLAALEDSIRQHQATVNHINGKCNVGSVNGDINGIVAGRNIGKIQS